MAEPWILAIDLGTGGLKIGAVSLTGEIIAHAHRTVQTHFSDDGGAVQDPREWWRGIHGGVAEVMNAGPAPGSLIGVGITGQWGSTVPVDARGEAVGDCLLWSDTRGGPLSAATMGGPVQLFGYSPGNMLRWLQITGGAPSPHGADPLGHSHYLRDRESEVYERATTLLEPLDYLCMRFTGRRAATQASMILSWLTDNRRAAPLGYVPELVRRSRRDPEKLPELLPTGSVLGPVLPEVGEELGIPPGVPVVAGVPDLHTAYVGSGAVAPYEGHVTISTTSWIACEVPFKRTDVLHQLASVPGLREGSYLVANNHETAGLCLQWLRDSVISPKDSISNGETPDFTRLTALAEAVPAGSGGVIFTPWLKGERSPVEDRTLRAAFVNLSMTNTRAHMVRSVLEGVALNARWLLDAVEGFVKRPFPRLRILGGGAACDLWCQIHADVLRRPIERVDDPMYSNLRGAGLFAGMALGRLQLADIPRLVKVHDTFEPDAGDVATYDGIYHEYKRLYGRLRGVYAKLNGRR